MEGVGLQRQLQFQKTEECHSGGRGNVKSGTSNGTRFQATAHEDNEGLHKFEQWVSSQYHNIGEQVKEDPQEQKLT